MPAGRCSIKKIKRDGWSNSDRIRAGVLRGRVSLPLSGRSAYDHGKS